VWAVTPLQRALKRSRDEALASLGDEALTFLDRDRLRWGGFLGGLHGKVSASLGRPSEMVGIATLLTLRDQASQVYPAMSRNIL
jgi:hypothetical protein